MNVVRMDTEDDDDDANEEEEEEDEEEDESMDTEEYQNDERMDTEEYDNDDEYSVPTSSSSKKRKVASRRKGSSSRKIKRAIGRETKRQKKEVPEEDVAEIILMYQFGQENEFFKRLFEILGEGYAEKFEMFCMGSAIRMLSGRNGSGCILGGPSKYPQGMTCLTFAICNGEIFQHTAKSDVAHQKRCWRALLLAYARENREVVLAYGRQHF